jgi:O-methyltransferase
MNRFLFGRICHSALGHRTSQEATYDLACALLERNVPGDFYECGVYAGASCALMAHAIMDNMPHRPIAAFERSVHLFDTFTGIPAPGEFDTDLAANRGGESACSMGDVQRNMARWGVPEEMLVYHAGLFCETVPYHAGVLAARKHRIAMLRLDGDLYESTRVCLEQLYPLVSPGGYVIVDDFNLSGSRKATLDYFKESGPAPIIWRKPE